MAPTLAAVRPSYSSHTVCSQRRRCRRRPAAAAASAVPQQQGLDPEQLQRSIVVVGGGPAGLAAAAGLQQAGLPAVVLERAAGPPATGAALGLWTNAWKALEALGAAEPLRQQHPAVNRIEICRQTGQLLRGFGLGECDGGPHEFRGVRRATLLAALSSQLAPGSIHYNVAVTGAEQGPGGSGAVLRLGSGERLECLAAVGADGVRSAVVAATGRGPPNYCGQSAIRGIARFPGGVPLDCIRQVWSGGPRAGMYPVSETEVYWFACFDAPADLPVPETAADIKAEALMIVRGWGWGVEEAVEATPLEDLTRSRLVDRWDLPGRSSSSSSGCLALAGDALHPMTPNLGQGGCTALEDGVVLARSLQQARLPELLAELPGGKLGSAGTTSGGRGARERVTVAMGEAFAAYERERAARCLPLTVRSNLMGAALQLPFPPVTIARDLFVRHAFSASHFLDHATYDCGRIA